MKLSPTMRRVLKRIAKDGRSSPYRCKCAYTTFVALAERKLIRVDTTLGSIAFTRNAEATLTAAGRAMLGGRA